MAPFYWEDNATEAAELVARGNLTLGQICEKLDISYPTLRKWREHLEFRARVEEHREEFRQFVRNRGIAVLERRVAALNDRWTRMRRIIEARADSKEMAGVPGGNTGLLVREEKALGSGDNFQVVEVYSFDGALVREIREHEKQAAQELGQWTERKHIETRDLDLDEAVREQAAREIETWRRQTLEKLSSTASASSTAPTSSTPTG